jgi:hypothetical protein
VLWGFLAATVLNGVISFLLREVARGQVGGVTYRPWNALVLAAVVTAVVTLVLFRMERPRAATGVVPPRGRVDAQVWIALIVLVALGLALVRSVETRMTEFTDQQGGLRAAYPSSWIPVPGSSAVLDVQDPLSGTGVPARLIVARAPRVADQTVGQIATESALERGQRMAMYRVLAERPAKIGGRDALEVRYAFVADPHQLVLQAQRLPVVVQGLQLIIPAESVVYHVDLYAAAEIFDRVRPEFERIISDFRF